MLTASVFADGGREVGLGHFRRCVNIAQALRARGVLVSLLVPDDALRAAGLQLGFETSVVDRAMPVLPAADMAIVDGYAILPECFSAWRAQFGTLVAIDDHGARPVPAHIVVNPNLYGGEIDYRAYGADAVLAGPQFSMIDSAFSEIRAERRQQPVANETGVLVWFGGTDDGTLAGSLAEALIELGERRVEMIVSPLQPIAAVARDLARCHGDAVRLHHGADLRKLMGSVRAYAGAAGTSVMEAIAAGLSVAAYCLADNQELNVAYLRRHGVEVLSSFDAGELAAMVRRAVPADSLAVLLDGRGGQRICDVLMARRGAAGRGES